MGGYASKTPHHYSKKVNTSNEQENLNFKKKSKKKKKRKLSWKKKMKTEVTIANTTFDHPYPTYIECLIGKKQPQLNSVIKETKHSCMMCSPCMEFCFSQLDVLIENKLRERKDEETIQNNVSTDDSQDTICHNTTNVSYENSKKRTLTTEEIPSLQNGYNTIGLSSMDTDPKMSAYLDEMQYVHNEKMFSLSEEQERPQSILYFDNSKPQMRNISIPEPQLCSDQTEVKHVCNAADENQDKNKSNKFKSSGFTVSTGYPDTSEWSRRNRTSPSLTSESSISSCETFSVESQDILSINKADKIDGQADDVNICKINMLDQNDDGYFSSTDSLICCSVVEIPEHSESEDHGHPIESRLNCNEKLEESDSIRNSCENETILQLENQLINVSIASERRREIVKIVGADGSDYLSTESNLSFDKVETKSCNQDGIEMKICDEKKGEDVNTNTYCTEMDKSEDIKSKTYKTSSSYTDIQTNKLPYDKIEKSEVEIDANITGKAEIKICTLNEEENDESIKLENETKAKESGSCQSEESITDISIGATCPANSIGDQTYQITTHQKYNLEKTHDVSCKNAHVNMHPKSDVNNRSNIKEVENHKARDRCFKSTSKGKHSKYKNEKPLRVNDDMKQSENNENETVPPNAIQEKTENNSKKRKMHPSSRYETIDEVVRTINELSDNCMRYLENKLSPDLYRWTKKKEIKVARKRRVSLDSNSLSSGEFESFGEKKQNESSPRHMTKTSIMLDCFCKQCHKSLSSPCSRQNIPRGELRDHENSNIDIGHLIRETNTVTVDSGIVSDYEMLSNKNMTLHISLRKTYSELIPTKERLQNKKESHKQIKIIKKEIRLQSKTLKNLTNQQDNIFSQLYETSKAISKSLSHFSPDDAGIIVCPGLEGYFERLRNGPPPSLEEQMQYEWFRLSSFHHYTGIGSAIVLARNGFYHDSARGNSETRCFACGVNYSTWSEFDDVEVIHRKLSPNCPHVQRHDTESRNVSITQDEPRQEWMTATAMASNGDDDAATVTSAAGGNVESAAQGATGGPSSMEARVQNITEQMRQAHMIQQVPGESLSLQPQEDAHNVLFRSNPSALAKGETRAQVPATAIALALPRTSGLPRYASTHNNLAQGARTNVNFTTPVSATEVKATTSAIAVTIPAITTVTNTRSEDSKTQQRSNSPQAGQFSTPSQPEQEPQPPATSGAAGGGKRPDEIVVSNPKHPDYASIDRRADSFNGWPTYLDQTARQMAEAGFFYAGVADFTRCFCCGGGLRNWEPGDDPVLEHTRWYPTCNYVNNLKGARYVQAAVRRQQQHMEERQRQQAASARRRDAKQLAPDPMNTPAAGVLCEMGYSVERVKEAILTVRAQTGYNTVSAQQALVWILDIDENGEETTNTTRRSISPTIPAATTRTLTPPTSTTTNQTMAPSQAPHTTTAPPSVSTSSIQSNESSTSTTAVAGSLQGLAGGSNDDTRKGSSSPSHNATGKKSNRIKKKKPSSTTNSGPLVGATGTSELDTQSLKEENDKLREMQTCKICMERPVNVTLLPCGHLVCCQECAPKLVKCPICRQRIKGTVKTFMS